MSSKKLDPISVVRQGYDRIAERYAERSAKSQSTQRDRLIGWLLETLPEGAAVLDLGCGNGEPVARRLSESFQVTGVDLSSEQLRRARAAAPGATFIEADMMAINLPAESWAAIVACFSMIHVPRESHPDLLRQVAHWLEPGGWFVCSIGAGDLPAGYEDDWLGAPMFWSNFDPATTRRLIEESGLTVVEQLEEAVDEDGNLVPFVWFVAQRPDASPINLDMSESRTA